MADETPKSTVTEDLAKVIEETNKELGEQMIVPGFEMGLGDVRGHIPWGCDLLDIATTFYDEQMKPKGCAFALGRWSEHFGWESTGKTTELTSAMIQCQKNAFLLGQLVSTGLTVMVDSDSSFDKGRAARMGWDEKRHLEIIANYLEKGIDGIRSVLKSVRTKDTLMNIPVLIVWDTPSAISTYNEKYGDKAFAGGMMEKPRIMHAFKRLLSTELPASNAHLAIVTQLIDGADGTTTSGGSAMRYQASWRVELKKRYDLYTDQGMPYGIYTEFFFRKSKMFKPYARVPVALRFETGFDNVETNIAFLKDVGAIGRGGWYNLEPMGQESSLREGPWREAFAKMYNEDAEFRARLLEYMRQFKDALWFNKWQVAE